MQKQKIIMVRSVPPLVIKRTLPTTPEIKRTIQPMPDQQRTTSINLFGYEIYLYEQMTGMLIKATKIACLNSGYDFEEMKQHADFLFVRALRKFDETRNTKFSTFLHSVLHNGLVDYGIDLRKHESWNNRVFLNPSYDAEDEIPALEVENMIDEVSSKHSRLIEDYNSLSLDAKELADMALFGMGSNLKKIETLAIMRLGYTKARFNKAVAELRQMVNTWS